jgi:type I restriction enzyme S subunit
MEVKVNDIPRSWVQCSLNDLLSALESGSRPKGGVKGIKSGTPSIGGEHLRGNGTFDFSSIKYVPVEYARKMTKGHIQKNDILIVKDGATTGKTAFIDANFPFEEAVVNEHVFICRPTLLIEPRFLFRYLTSKDGQDQILSNFKGSAQGGINLSFASSTSVSLAPLNEQHRIVAKLERLLQKVDACKERLDRIPAILKGFRQSVLATASSGRLTADWRSSQTLIETAQVAIQNCLRAHRPAWETRGFQKFSGKGKVPKNGSWKKKYLSPKKPDTNRIPEFPVGWAYTTLSPLLTTNRLGIKTGPFGTLLKRYEHQAEGVPVFGIENIGESRFIPGSKIHITKKKAEQLKAYDAKPGDVLISRSGTVGQVCVVPNGVGEARISTNLMRISIQPERMLPDILCILFKGSEIVRDQISALCGGSTRDFLNRRILRSLIFPLPPLAEQEEIVRRIEVLFKVADRIEERYQKVKAYSDKLIQSILAKAFRGEVVPQDPNDEPASLLLERIKNERAKKETEIKVIKRSHRKYHSKITKKL